MSTTELATLLLTMAGAFLLGTPRIWDGLKQGTAAIGWTCHRMAIATHACPDCGLSLRRHIRSGGILNFTVCPQPIRPRLLAPGCCDGHPVSSGPPTRSRR